MCPVLLAPGWTIAGLGTHPCITLCSFAGFAGTTTCKGTPIVLEHNPGPGEAYRAQQFKPPQHTNRDDSTETVPQVSLVLPIPPADNSGRAPLSSILPKHAWGVAKIPPCFHPFCCSLPVLRDFSNYLIPLLIAQLVSKELLPKCSVGQWDISGILGSGHSGFEDEQIQLQDSSCNLCKETSQDLPQASPHVGTQLHVGQGRTMRLNPCLTETCSSSQAPSHHR